MAKIQEYNLTTSAAGPERQTAANIEDTGNTGQALANFGTKLEDTGSFIERRQGQEDVANQAAAGSGYHEAATDKMADMLQSATSNEIMGKNEDGSDGKSLTEKFSDYLGEQEQNLPEPSTRAGREFAERQRAQTRQHLMGAMIKGQSTLQGANAVATFQQTIQSHANALGKDPTGFEMAKSNMEYYSEAMVKTGGLPANKAPELVKLANSQLAEGAARGYMQANPTFAKQMIDSGHFDADINSDTKYKLSQEAEVHIHAEEAQQKVVQKQHEDAQKEVVQNTQNQLFDAIQSGKDVTKQIANDPNMNWQDKKQMLDIQIAHTKQKLATDPDVMTNTLEKIHSGEISDVSDLDKLIGHGINITTRNQLAKEIDKTPQGQMNASLTKNFLNMAKQQLKVAEYGMKDPEGATNYANFSAQYMDAIQKGKAAGKTVQQMLTPPTADKPNPDYLGYLITNNKRTADQVLNSQADTMIQQVQQASPKAAQPIRVNVNGKTYQYKGTAEQAKAKGYEVIK